MGHVISLTLSGRDSGEGMALVNKVITKKKQLQADFTYQTCRINAEKFYDKSRCERLSVSRNVLVNEIYL